MASKRLLPVAALALAGAVSACGSLQGARERMVRHEPQCQDLTVQIYFDSRSAEVTREARAVLRAAANQAKGCKVDKVSVLGLADAVGAPDANLDLSKARVAAVTQVLAAMRLPAAEFDLRAAGQSGAVTDQGVAPLRRRADITLKLSPPAR
jgi:outer membrane protein OmpA-like peptidoglycan-associated protein